MANRIPPVKIIPPKDGAKILVHCCCAPCSGPMIEALLSSKIDFALLFYNPNIQPRAEYELRKKCLAQHAEKKGVDLFDLDYDQKKWFEVIQGFEQAPERGQRCEKCFDLRLERAALYAHEYGFKIFTSSLGIARWKDMNLVNKCGIHVARKYPNLQYWTFNWRKNSGSERMYEIAKEERFYKQEYCGCIYSFMATNLKRCQTAQGPIILGSNFYEPNIHKETPNDRMASESDIKNLP